MSARRHIHTILGNHNQCYLRYDRDFRRYDAIVLDIRGLSGEHRSLVFHDIDLSFYNPGDTIRYTSYEDRGIVVARFEYGGDARLDGVFMVIRCETVADILHATFQSSDNATKYMKAWYVNSKLWLQAPQKWSDEEKDLIGDSVEGYRVYAFKEPDDTWIKVEYDKDYYKAHFADPQFL